jgi:hypothetical protein
MTPVELRSRPPQGVPVAAPRSAVQRLLMPPDQPAGRRLAIAGVAGILLSAPVSLQHALASDPAVGWLLTVVGAALAMLCLVPTWTPHQMLTRVAIGICVAFFAASAAVGVALTVRALSMTQQQLLCGTDVAPETVVSGQEMTRGADPYTAFNVLQAERSLGCPFFSATPLRSGVFARATSAPSLAQVEAAAVATTHGHPTGGLVLGFNYPAGTALLGAVGGPALVLISPILLLLAGFVIVRRAEPAMRRVTLLALGAQTGMLGLIGSPFVDLIVAALLMLAITKRRGWAMGIVLGIACATKQTAWFIAPALLVLALREGRGRDVRYHAGALVAFVIINIPFVAAGPLAWLTGALGPISQPEFPLGVGPGAVGQAGTASTEMFLALMVASVVIGVAISAFASNRWASVGIVVSSLGLWIGPRSLGDYVALLGVITVCTVIGSTSNQPGPRRRDSDDRAHLQGTGTAFA